MDDRQSYLKRTKSGRWNTSDAHQLRRPVRAHRDGSTLRADHHHRTICAAGGHAAREHGAGFDRLATGSNDGRGNYHLADYRRRYTFK